jgi:hypothetical protein
MAITTIDDLFLSTKNAEQSKILRTGLMAQLYALKPFVPLRDDGNAVVEQQNVLISDFLGAFKRYAGNQQTAYDSGSVQSSPTNTSNQWERVVDRAIDRALGKSPGKGANNFVTALDNAFTTQGYGRSTMTLNPSGNNYGNTGLLSEVSAEQAILYRQVSTNMADALKVLAEIQYFSPKADKESVESLRELVRGRITFLVEEFRRDDEPRSKLVEFYLRSLDEYTTEFGRQSFLINNSAKPVTVEDEEQITKFRLLESYLENLSEAWAGYDRRDRSERLNSLSIKVDRARTLLPIVSQANLDFSNALESVGLSQNERRSRASLFSAIDLPPILPSNPQSSGVAFPAGSTAIYDPSFLATWLPTITVNDLIEWLDSYSNIEAPGSLNSTYGIDFVTDQANRIFWTVAPVVAHIKFIPPNPSGSSMLKQILSNERVTWALDNILSQLNALADLAA